MDKNRNDKNRIALDMMSGVDEELLDKATNRRATLLAQLARRRKTKKIIFSSASVAACLAIIFCAVFLIPLFTKQVPVYTGMTVSNTAPTAQGSAALPKGAEGEITLLSLPDYNPFAMSYSLEAGAPAEGENGQTSETAPDESVVAEKIRDTLAVTGAEETIYYAQPKQDIYITVHVDNPDSFEILSFTLNGEKYSSYMFEEGSNMENLILKVNVGDVEGVVEYTIDAIKYVDGTEIKDVRMDGDRTVKVGVATPKQPVATVTDETVGISDIAFGVTVTDELNLIAESEGMMKVVLLDGETVVVQEDLAVGETKSVSFEGLSPDHIYTYGVCAYYDSLNGEGSKLHILFQKEIRTERAVWFRDTAVTQTTVTFGIEWNEAATSKTIQKLLLYRGDAKIRELRTDTVSLDSLLSGQTYRLVAEYLYGDRVETAECVFTTVAKAIPTYEITVGSLSQTSVGFDIVETDTDTLGNITKVELLHATEAARDGGTDIRFFDGLQRNQEYTIQVTYAYDINDGNGTQTRTVTQAFCTYAREITVTSITPLESLAIKPGAEISYKVTVDNPDSVEIQSFVISGQTVKAVFFGENTYMVSYKAENSAGGKKELTIETISYLSFGHQLHQPTSYQQAEFYVVVLAPITVEEATIQGDKTLFDQNESATLLLRLSDAACYDVQSVRIKNGGDFACERIDETTYSVTVQFSDACVEIVIYGFTYGVGADLGYVGLGHEKWATVPFAVLPEYSGIVEVSTPEQLQNMTHEVTNREKPVIYRLVNDIDLSGFDWQPYKFTNILDGNGYEIKNLTIAQTLLNSASSPGIGLFSSIGGSSNGKSGLYNVKLSNVSISVLVSDNSSVCYVGGLAGYSGTTNVYDCKVQGEIQCTFYPGSAGGSSVKIGGISGWSGSSVELKDCCFDGTITFTGYRINTGTVDIDPWCPGAKQANGTINRDPHTTINSQWIDV